jgi:hypothetical protein
MEIERRLFKICMQFNTFVCMLYSDGPETYFDVVVSNVYDELSIDHRTSFKGIEMWWQKIMS